MSLNDEIRRERQEAADFLRAVRRLSPDGIREYIRKNGAPLNMKYPLAYACRYRGLETVRALVEGRGELVGERDERESVCYTALFDDEETDGALCAHTADNKQAPLPRSERQRVLEYLIENKERSKISTDYMLFCAFVYGETDFVKLMKSMGVTFSKRAVNNLTVFPGRSDLSIALRRENSDERIISALSDIISELPPLHGKKRKLFMPDMLWDDQRDEFFVRPAVARFIAENFVLFPYMKERLLKRFVDMEDIQGLEAAARAGWFKSPERRELITRYASENGRAESAAWLLDYIGCNCDLAAERERAEKRRLRLLSAAPDSITIMRDKFRWRKRSDGTIEIALYIGDEKTVKVPAKIGKRAVTAIGEGAFYPDKINEFKRRLFDKDRLSNYVINVSLPDTITDIGEEAFSHCYGLERLDIPPKVTEIPEDMLMRSGVSRAEIGGNVKKVGDGAFGGCYFLNTVIIHEGVEELGDETFGDCDSLETIELPRSLIRIDDRAFGIGEFYGTAWVHKDSRAEAFCGRKGIDCKYIKE